MSHRYSPTAFSHSFAPRHLLFQNAEVPTPAEVPAEQPSGRSRIPNLLAFSPQTQIAIKSELTHKEESRVDEKVWESARKQFAKTFKNQADLEKAVNAFIDEHIGDYKNLPNQHPHSHCQDMVSKALICVKNFPLAGVGKDIDTQRPRYSFDEQNRIVFAEKVTLVSNNPEEVQKQAQQALEFLKDNIVGAEDANELSNRVRFPMSRFKLLSEGQRVAVADKALTWLWSEHPDKAQKIFPGMLQPRAFQSVNGVLQFDNGINRPGQTPVLADHRVWTLADDWNK